LAALEAQRKLPDAELPPPFPPPLNAAQREQVKTLKGQVRDIAGTLAVAPEVLVYSKDYELLLREASGERIKMPVHWHGWRKEIALAPLRQALGERGA
jgi:ribonuclease D